LQPATAGVGVKGIRELEFFEAGMFFKAGYWWLGVKGLITATTNY
jgi:hypothetical protein